MITYSNDRKALSRKDTVTDAYAHIFGTPVLQGQMWSLCARGDEYRQLTNDGFLKPGQYHGVDSDLGNIEANRADFPEANWHHGDLFTVLSHQITDLAFNPAIVNFDSVEMKRAVNYGMDLIELLESQHRIMVVVNVVLTIHGHEPIVGYMAEQLAKSGRWARAERLGWRRRPEAYRYRGHGPNTVMETHIFWRD